jgi:hypothetical protein
LERFQQFPSRAGPVELEILLPRAAATTSADSEVELDAGRNPTLARVEHAPASES